MMGSASTPRKKSFEDYLHDVAGESQDVDEDDEVELQRLKVKITSSEDNRSTQSRSSQRRQRGTPVSGGISPQLTEARSFVNGLLSPFSPLLGHQEQREEFLEHVSLQPCRKVSVVVRVLPCEDDAQRCLFPHVKNVNPHFQMMKSPNDMVVVKPSAFGKVIPSSFTMETARLVAQVAHISSEDWARLYEFHHVMWPSYDEGTQNADQFSTMDSLSRAVVQDAVVERQSSLLISMGQAPTCLGGTYEQKTCQLAKIIAHCQRLMEPKSVATVSMVELKEGKNTFRDLLNRRNTQVSIRHVDMKGAVLEGLSHIPIDEVHNHWPKDQASTVVATISIWDNAVSHDINREPDSQITCVELAQSLGPIAKAQSKSSTVSLGLALRQLLRHAPQGVDPAISFRESTITKVLQRSLEASKIVLLASVSQLSHDYETTLATLNFLRHLLVKPGKTASSPFPKRQPQASPTTADTITMTDMLQEYATDETMLQQIIADPRQRLAKIMKPSPTKKADADIEIVPSSDEDYNPVDYMQNFDIDEPAWQSPVPTLREETRLPSTSIRNGVKQSLWVDAQQPLKDDWNMEEPNDDPMPYPSLSESSQDESESPPWQRSIPHAEGKLFDDYSGNDALGEHDDDKASYSRQGPLPIEELVQPHAAGDNSFDESEEASLDQESDQFFAQDDVYPDQQKVEDLFGESRVLEAERPSMELFEASSRGSNDLSSLVETQGSQLNVQDDDFNREEKDAESVGPEFLGANEISHEIVFAADDEYDSDSLSSGHEEPQMWSENREIEYGKDDLDPSPAAYHAEGTQSETTLDMPGVYNQSIDGLLTSRESRSTFSIARGNGSSQNTDTAYDTTKDQTSRYEIRQDGQSWQRPAFEAVSPLGPAQSSHRGTGQSSHENITDGHVVERTTAGEFQVLEVAADQMQNWQSALWRSRYVSSK
jgi:hypothetical protein